MVYFLDVMLGKKRLTYGSNTLFVLNSYSTEVIEVDSYTLNSKFYPWAILRASDVPPTKFHALKMVSPESPNKKQKAKSVGSFWFSSRKSTSFTSPTFHLINGPSN